MKYEVRADDTAEMEALLAPLTSAKLRAVMLERADFKKHCEACAMLVEALPGLGDEAVSCLDLLLRWAVVRISEGNTQLLVKVRAKRCFE